MGRRYSFLVLNGPNLNLLGKREVDVYGSDTLADLEELVTAKAEEGGFDVAFLQSNHEGVLIDAIQQAPTDFDGIVYNPGAHTHYSYAIRDAIASIPLPVIEVHISDIATREAFRRVSVVADVCIAQVKGEGFDGYLHALDMLHGLLEDGRVAEQYPGVDIPANEDGHVGTGRGFDIDDGVGALMGKEQDMGFAGGIPGEATSASSGSGCGLPDRVAPLRAVMDSLGLDAYLAHHNSDLCWLTGYLNLFDEEQAHFGLITRDKLVMHTDSRYINAFEARAAQAPTPWTFTCEPRRVGEFIACQLDLPRSRTVRIGIEDDLPWVVHERLGETLAGRGIDFEFVELASPVTELRSLKDDREIDRLKASQAITDAAFAHMLDFIRIGMSESEVALELEYTMRKMGAQGLAFPSIVAAGERGASAHSIPGERTLQAGDLVVMDFGARKDDYCSDMTRTICIGRADDEQRRVYATVLHAQEEAKAALRAGVKGSEIHGIAARVIGDAGHALHFGHALGHGVGIDIHEMPTLSPVSDTILLPGAVVTVEPGIYLPGKFGIRIEDFGVVRPDGFEVFTRSTHELLEIG